MICIHCDKDIDPILTETPKSSPHHMRQDCPECGKFNGFLSKPKNKNKRVGSRFTPENLGIIHCEFCLRSLEMLGSHQTLEIHHKMPISLGGLDVETNVLVLCTLCHKFQQSLQKYLYNHYLPQTVDEAIKPCPKDEQPS